MDRRRPLRDYPAATLEAVSGIITTLLLGYQDLLPTDLYVKLDLFRGDLTDATRRPSPRRPAGTAPRPASRQAVAQRPDRALNAQSAPRYR